jgi:hypothetical protein
MTELDSFSQSAADFTRSVTRSLKFDKPFPRERMTEPSASEAEEYIKGKSLFQAYFLPIMQSKFLQKTFAAYFDNAQESAFGMIDRQSFEDRLQAHFKTSATDDDQAWYALRNAIYATGARIALSRKASFRVASDVSWAYFCNAFAVHSELVYFKSTLMAIQALAVMVRASLLNMGVQILKTSLL